MADATEADRYLLDRLAAGDAAAWAQLVDRYQGRLLAFARSRLPRPDDAADVVQDTFLAFLQARRTFRPDASLETFLFTILRRRLVDLFRGRRVAACGVGGDGEPDGDDEPVDPGPTPSGYARRDERVERLEAAVAAGLDGMVRRLRDGRLLAELRMAELLFYAQLRNRDVAARCGVTEGHVAGFKFRALAQIRDHAAAAVFPADAPWSDAEATDSVLTRVWERLRPTCPKRSTLGRLLLGTLDDDWHHHAEFHLHTLGCRLCLANWDDLRRESAASAAAPPPDAGRIFQSTVGFLART